MMSFGPPSIDAAQPAVVGDWDLAETTRNLYDLFDERARATPDAVAIVGESSTLTYSQLRHLALDVSADLRNAGLDREEVVGVFMRRTPEVIAVLLGILHAGGAYVPLDPAEPTERALLLAERAGLRRVFVDATTATRLAPLCGKTLTLIDVDAVHRTPSAPLDTGPSAPGDRSLAYVMFTSGSTGRPKGVEVEHRNVVNLLLAAQRAFEFDARDRYLAVSTLSFDISVVEVFLPLICGASLVLRDKQLLLTQGATAAAIEQHGVTVFQTGPSVWKLLLEGRAAFPRLRVAITTGEAVPPVLADRVAKLADIVWNLYGPTETTIWCSGHRLDLPDGLDDATACAAPVGACWPNMPGVVVDDDGDEVDEGTPGELWVGGLAVTRGYRFDAERTAERYVARADGERYYRTGDIVEKTSSGVLRFFGRNDDQVQVHGVRVEPMEVEELVIEDRAVRQAAATWFDHAEGRSIVVGVVLHDDEQEDREVTGSLRDRLAERVPTALIPARVIAYDQLPLTPNGKTDRIAIRTAAEALDHQPVVDSADASLTPTEHTLRAIWSATLRSGPIRRNDSFFGLGGDSLAAVSMLLDAEDAFGIDLPICTVYEAPTLGELSHRIDRLRKDSRLRPPQPSSTRGSAFELVQRGSGRPVFFCAIETHLARDGAWRVDAPLYAVNYWTLGRGFSRAGDVASLAAEHVRDIRAVQAHGPYRLAGYSFGGLVALEIAQQLRNAGDEVEMLFLLDPTEPYRRANSPDLQRRDLYDDYRKTMRAADERVAHRLARHALQMVRHPTDAVSYARKRLSIAPMALLQHHDVWPWIQYRIVDLHGRRPNRVTARLLPEDRWQGFWYAAQRIARNYVAQTYDGPTLAVFLDRGERHDAWAGILGERAELRVVRSSHGEILADPALHQWIDLLADRLDAAGTLAPPQEAHAHWVA